MESFVGAVFAFGFNFAPYGWAQCNGQLLPISQYQALFSLIGTTYGGDGVTSFGLPNLQGRAPIGTGQGTNLPNYTLGQTGGSENVTLTLANLPSHSHTASAVVHSSSTGAAVAAPTGNIYTATPGSTYSNTQNGQMHSTTGNTGITGSSIPMNILNPYLVVNYCISLYGIFPTRN